VTNGVFHPNGLQGPVTIAYSVGPEPCTITNEGTITIQPAPLAHSGADGSTCTNSYELEAQLSSGIGTWILPPGATILPDPHAPNGIVTFTMDGSHVLTWQVVDGPCSTSDTLIIDVMAPGAPLSVDAGPDQYLSLSTNTHLTGSASSTGYILWTIAEGTGLIAEPTSLSTEVEALGLGRNVFVLTVGTNACRTASDTVHVVVEDLFIPEGFSPNGDGVNDRFEITGIAAWPRSELQVFNRWGQEVYADDGYTNAWDGRSANGRELPDDTYFYVLDLGGERSYNGYVIIKR
jgi:gliding motility-associated-like protein